MTIGERIKEARLNAGITQRELAEKLGVSFVNISQWENGTRKPKYETRQKIADALGVTVDYLLGRTNQPNVRLATQEDIERYFGRTSYITEDGVAVLAAKPDMSAHDLKKCNENYSKLCAAFDRLNETGQKKAVENVEDLAKIPEYQKKDEPGQK